MKVEQQYVAVRGRELAQCRGHGLGVAVGAVAVGDVQQDGRETLRVSLDEGGDRLVLGVFQESGRQRLVAERTGLAPQLRTAEVEADRKAGKAR